jgi:UDP-N-acetylmuramate dehydrogenase
MTIEENIPLAPLTTFHIGGPARCLAHVQDIKEMHEALSFAKKKELQVLILGGGSNVLIADAGFEGLVIKIEIAGVEIKKEGEKVFLIAGAGENWDALVQKAVAENLWGVENLSGIPGTVGAAPVQNIGAYGTELKDTLAWVEALDTRSGGSKKFLNSECGFSYRSSIFKKEAGRFVVLRVALQLSVLPKPNISYRDLLQVFSENMHPTLGEIRTAVLAIRAAKFPDLAKEGTAGSFFLNPIVSKDLATKLAEQYPGLPQFLAEEGLPDGKASVKLSLAWLLDHVLNLRGLRRGRARLFEKQPLVIVAEHPPAGGCSARDVVALAEEVEWQVKEKIGIEIEREVRIL